MALIQCANLCQWELIVQVQDENQQIWLYILLSHFTVKKTGDMPSGETLSQFTLK